MSALTRFERVDDTLPELFRRMWKTPAMPADLPQEIRLNVSETPAAYTVKAEMPGARKEDIRVTLDGNQLMIAAEVMHETEKKDGERVLMREMTQGSIARGLTLGYEIDQAEATATFENGVLELKLPKRKPAGGRTITVT